MELSKTQAIVKVGTLANGKDKTVWGLPVTESGVVVGVIESSSNSRIWTGHIVTDDKPKYWNFRTRKEAFDFICERSKDAR